LMPSVSVLLDTALAGRSSKWQFCGPGKRLPASAHRSTPQQLESNNGSVKKA
jgi:hypothetical protein